MDGATHVLKKIILHSNVVSLTLFTDELVLRLPNKIGSPQFQKYQRCPWEIMDPSSSSEEGVVSCLDSLEDIKAFLRKYSEASQPMELDRSEDYDALSIPSSFTRKLTF